MKQGSFFWRLEMVANKIHFSFDNESKQKVILIFGISSFVGSNLAEILKKDFKVVGSYYKNPVSIKGIVSFPCDVLKKEDVQMALYTFRPDITIYAVGLHSINDCDENVELAEALNSAGLFNVTEFCQRYKSQICYISSCYVFGGGDKKYVETDIPDSVSLFGKTKATAEFFVQKTSLNYIVFRCCNLYGRGISVTKSTWFEKLERSTFEGESMIWDNHVFAGFLDIYFLGLLIKMCFENMIRNRVFQVSSSDVITFYDFAKMYVKTFGAPDGLVAKGKWNFPLLSYVELSLMEQMNFRMDYSNLESFLNISLPSVQESLNFTKKRLCSTSTEGSKKTKKGGAIIYI